MATKQSPKPNESQKIARRDPRDYTLKSERGIRKELIKERISIYANALRIPPAINQFKQFLNENDTQKILKFFMKFRPENRSEKKQRLAQENPRAGSKPILTKFGLKHVVSLIEQKKAKLVLIAADVNPIEVVIFLPTLCRKMGVSYAILEKAELLGPLVNLKKTSCVCLCETGKDSGEFKNLVSKCDAMFLDNYESVMKSWGGGIHSGKVKEN